MEMEFREQVNTLYKKFFDIVKQRYGVSRLIVKMICEKGLYRGMSDADLAFRTCKLYRFSDKHIDKLYNKDIEKAIQLLRARGVACLYITESLNDMAVETISMNNEYVKFLEGVYNISDQIYILVDQSIKKSDDWARMCDLPLFKDGKFDINDYKHQNTTIKR